jgi:type IV secretory pathway VirB10-like protein
MRPKPNCREEEGATMDSNNEITGTDIVEEHETAPKKKGYRAGLLISIGAAICVIVAGAMIFEFRKPQLPAYKLTAEELEQQKLDLDENKREQQKAGQLRDQSFLIRKGEDNQAQLNSILKDIDLDKGQNPALPTPAKTQPAAEEEAIGHVLQKSTPPPSRVRQEPAYAVPPRAAQYETGSQKIATNGKQIPMFIYSRSFGGAAYFNSPQKPDAAVKIVAAGESTLTKTSLVDNSQKAPEPNPRPEDKKTELIYTDYPPVTLYEGEMLEAVLVNRIIADTEPSPVICQLSKDVFDHSASYVVIPASSRIVGVSQVVNYKGANRLFINFHRIILPNGPSIDLPPSQKALKALDETGALGVASHVERHWFLQFGTGIFFGVLDGLSAAAQRSDDLYSTRSLVLGRTSDNFQKILDKIMDQYSSIAPTIRVDQGKTMKIYLSDDILISPFARVKDRSYYANR